MIKLSLYKHKAFGVFGLGKAGAATVASLLKGGAGVFAWDDKEESRNALRKAHRRAKIVPVAQWPWEKLTALVLSPGVPLTHPAPHPVVHLARKNNVEITGDVELLYHAFPKARYVGITGTNGKSTTTTLAAHILKVAKLRTEVGGNLGTPALALAPLDEDGTYVLELSSYQLDLLHTTRFSVAALLNLTPDHLDRHGDMEGYLAAKLHIFDRQQADDVAVIAAEDAYTIRAAKALEAGRRVVRVEASPLLYGIDLRAIPSLQGRHNWQNAAVAYAVAEACGVAHETIAEGMRSFPGLAHRMEPVGEAEGVRFVNDSKATNAEATANALAAYENIYWIAGGKPKAGGIAGLGPYFPKIRHAFLIGEASDAFAATLEGKVPYTRCGTLENAVEKAAAMALACPYPLPTPLPLAGEGSALRRAGEGAVVLLSPACASFDQFKSFEERGERFRALAAAHAP